MWIIGKGFNREYVSKCRYNYIYHDKYISQAVHGVLIQKFSFDVELIIANDCSTDRTDFVINDLLISHENSGWIKYTRHLSNKGPVGNSI